MACTAENCFDICLRIVINTRRNRAEIFVQCGEECSGPDVEFDNEILTIVLPLIACVKTTLKDDLSAEARLESLSLPGYF